jgi:DNA-binding protein H-NS
MKSYQSIVAEIRKLQGVAEKRRSEAFAAAIAAVRRTMAEFGITLEELAKALQKRAAAPKGKKGRRAKPQKKGRKVAPKYRDPKSGATWSGRGLAPKWLAEKEKAGAKREDFLIAKPAVKKAG